MQQQLEPNNYLGLPYAAQNPVRVPQDDLVSLSAGTLDSILAVQFEDADEEREYNNVFYPPRKAAKGHATRRKHYAELFDYLAEVSAVANLILAQARFIYTSVPMLEAGGAGTDEIQTHMMANLLTLQEQVTESVLNSYVREVMGTVAQGKAHIIRPSTRFTGGQDVLFSGVPNAAYGRTSLIFVGNLASAAQLPTYESQVTDLVRNSNYAELAVNIADAVSKWITGVNTATSGASPSKRLINQVRIERGTWDVNDLVERVNGLLREFGFNKGLAGFKLKADLPAELVEGLGKYFSFLVAREPNHNILSAIQSRPGTAETETEVSVGRTKLQVEYGLSFAMNLPTNIASYITQTPKGGKMSIVALNTWVNVWARALIRSPRSKQNSASGERLTVASTPRYVLMPSNTPAVTERRKALGLYAEPGRSNDDNIFISTNGRFHYCPPSSDVVIDNAKSYEALQEEALQVSFDAGAPLIGSQSSYASNYFAQMDTTYRDRLKGLKSDLNRYAGALQTYNWDYNCILTSSRSDPDRLVSIPLTGSIKPDSLAVSEYLTKPVNEAFAIMFPDISVEDVKGEIDSDKLKDFNVLLRSSVFKNAFEAYRYLLHLGKVPDLQTLIDRAVKALDISSLDPATVFNEGAERPARYEIGLYTSATRLSANVMSDNLKVLDSYKFKGVPEGFTLTRDDPSFESKFAGIQADLVRQTDGISKMLGAAMHDATGGARSNLLRVAMDEGTAVDDDQHYFDMAVHNLSDFSNLYNYLGGRVFYEMLQALLKTDRKDLMVVNPKIPLSIPSFAAVVKEIMPLATFLGKYVPESERILEEGEALSENLKKDESITTDDIHLPGSKANFQMFPHQAESFQTLGRHPRFGTLDIAPGGGKTILGLTDIGNLIHKGMIGRPAVLCPNGLVRNWIEDMHSVTEGKWNLIPITTATYRTWGDERLTKLIKDAPINTIFVIGLSLLRLETYQVVIGNHVEKVSGTLEFCKKFGFDYVILDESHKAKNMRSMTHKAIKQLTVSSSVKYVRIATGSLIQTKLTDVVGQAALFGAHIFRTQEEYESENSVPVGSGRATVFASDTPYRARAQLSKHSAVVSFKRKEWAFLLPRPIETFFSVTLNPEDDEVGQAHQLMYEAVLKETLEEIKGDPSVMKMLRGGSDDDDSDDDEDSPEALYERAGKVLGSGEPNSILPTSVSDDMDDASMAELEMALQPYLARLEQMLTDPIGDAFGGQFFKGMNKGDYVSRKVKKIIERITLNFNDFPWEKGTVYKLKALADYNGIRYVLMGEPGKKLTLEDYKMDYTSTIEPDKDPRWKAEPMGKVIVFCRYTRSVNAIYRALPPDLQKIAVKFSGEEANKWQNLEAFRTTPYSREKGVQIFIANEQAVSEGHNLQMASRIVRCESPWSPGELDQSSSRIFRPDTTGKFRRENIYLDWVLCNNTLEVAKLGRLISRMVDKAKFDEATNTLYAPLEKLELHPISMSLDTIAATPYLDDIREYLDAYQDLVLIQSAEFEELRQTKPSKMLDVPPTEMPKGSAILEQVPYLPTLKSVPDRHNYGLKKLTTYLQDSDDVEVQQILDNKDLLIGQYAHTEMGNGIIVRVRASAKGSAGLSSVTVQLANGDLYQADPSMIYLAQNLTKENVADFTPKNRWASETDKKKAAAEERRRERAAEREDARAAKSERRIMKEANRLAKVKAAEKEAAKAAKTKTAVKKKRVKAPVEEEEEQLDNPMTVELYPVVYNGFLAVEATPGEDDERHMKKIGFKNFGDYAYLQIKDQISFHAVLEWLDTKFYLRSETRKRLQNLAESFQSGRGRKFNVELAPLAEFKNFYNISHRLAGKDKNSGLPELKVYPVIINGALFLNVDISTNPIIRKHLNKLIKGTKNVKWQEADGLWIQFFRSRNEVVRWSKEVIAKGFEIENFADFKEQVNGLKDKLKQMQTLAK